MLEGNFWPSIKDGSNWYVCWYLCCYTLCRTVSGVGAGSPPVIALFTLYPVCVLWSHTVQVRCAVQHHCAKTGNGGQSARARVSVGVGGGVLVHAHREHVHEHRVGCRGVLPAWSSPFVTPRLTPM